MPDCSFAPEIITVNFSRIKSFASKIPNISYLHIYIIIVDKKKDNFFYIISFTLFRNIIITLTPRVIGGEREIMKKIVNIAKNTMIDSVKTTGFITAGVAIAAPMTIGTEIIGNAILKNGVKPTKVVKQVAAAAGLVATTAATSIIVHGVRNTVAEIRNSNNSVKTKFNDDEFVETDEVDEVVDEAGEVDEECARANAGAGSHNLDAPYLARQRCRGKLSATNTYGTGAPCLCGTRAEGARRADRSEHAGSFTQVRAAVDA